MELQRRKGDETQKAGTSHMYVVSCRGSKFEYNSLSNRLSNMGQDKDLHTRMEGLDNSIKLILTILIIVGVESTRIGKQNIETHIAKNFTENL